MHVSLYFVSENHLSELETMELDLLRGFDRQAVDATGRREIEVL
jgi:hypothetical protein